MIVFRKARKPNRTLNDLDAYIGGLGYEPIRLLDREIMSWGEVSYDELAQIIESGRYEDWLDFRERYSKVINEILAPMWVKAIEEASKKATRGMIVLSDSHDEVKEFLRNHGGELITNLSNESRKAVINVITRGIFERTLPKEIARQVRPLIGLTDRQAQQNLNYRAKVYHRYEELGTGDEAKRRADKAALRYAAKQHQFRAETIVLTETAFAYNHGADMGVRRAIRDNLMPHCEMVWTTAGVLRTCSRCLELNGKVVGTTDEQGVQIPPLHPRCRCAIIYREIETLKTPDLKEQHRVLTLQSEQLETRWRALQSEIEQLAPRGTSARLEALYAEQEPIGDKLWETEKNLRKIRLAAAEKGVILTTSLSRVFDVDNVKEIVQQLRTAPKNLRILWNMAEADMTIIDKNFRATSHYDLTRRGILFDAAEDFYKPTRRYKTLLHETGHLLDHFMGNRMYLYSYGYKGGAFAQTLIDEANAALKAEMARLKAEAVASGRSAKNIKLMDAQLSLSKTLQKIDHAARSEVSDIFSGATKNKVTGGYKHKNSYWREKETLPTEAFAHMFCATIQSPQSLEHIRHYFPKSYQIFEEMINFWVKETKEQWIGKNLTVCKKNMQSDLKRAYLRSKCRQPTSTMR